MTAVSRAKKRHWHYVIETVVQELNPIKQQNLVKTGRVQVKEIEEAMLVYYLFVSLYGIFAFCQLIFIFYELI